MSVRERIKNVSMAIQNTNSNPDKILIEKIITISDKINLDKAKIK